MRADDVTNLFAGCAVADLAVARPFYEALFGRPADMVPHAGEVCWQVREGSWVYVVEDPPRAGGGLVTVLVADLDALVSEWAARGVVPDVVEAVGDAGRKARIADPDGNELGFAQVG
jgi:predicted enzyme related to lactoylglutathione lyase